MSEQDLENQITLPASQQAELPPRADQAEDAAAPSATSRLRNWVRSFQDHMQTTSADSRDRYHGAGVATAGDGIESTANSSVATTMRRWLGISLSFIRVELESKDGFTTYLFDAVPRPFPVEDIFWDSVMVGSMIILRPIPRDGRSISVWVWWMLYLLVSDSSDFEHNFLRAWSQHNTTTSPEHRLESDSTDQTSTIPEENNQVANTQFTPDSENRTANLEETAVKTPGFVPIILATEYLEVPILHDPMTNPEFFKQLRMFYRYLKFKRGIVELIIPRRLARIDYVKVDEHTQMASGALETVECGRGLLYFHHPKSAPEEWSMLGEFRNAQTTPDYRGLEFVRVLNRWAIGVVIMVPPMASLLFVVLWLAIFFRRTSGNGNGVDTQMVVTTAFTIASYLVTAGALITGLVVYLDDRPAESQMSGRTANPCKQIQHNEVDLPNHR